MRFYKRIKNGLELVTQYFMTFKPSIDGVKLKGKIDSKIINQLIEQDKNFNKMGYGVGFYGQEIKYWFAPYGNQLEFSDYISQHKDLEPLLKIPKVFQGPLFDNNDIPHYIGYFPRINFHQIYYFLGKDDTKVHERLKGLGADYYGFSETFDNSFNVIKKNTYAIRVSYEKCKEIIEKEFPMFKERPKYLNLSHRYFLDGKEEMTLSYLLYDTSKINKL